MADVARHQESVYPPPEAAPALYRGLRLRRSIAYLIDLAILALLGLMAWVVLSLLTFLSFGLLFPLQVTVLACLPAAYHSVLIGLAGRTLGMAFLDLRVETLEGGTPGWLQALVLTLLFYASVALTAWLILAWTFFGSRKRLLHDLLSGCLVLRASALGRRPI